MKQCKACRKEKPLDQYYKHPKTVDGVHQTCKACFKKASRERYEEHKVQISERRKRRYKRKQMLKNLIEEVPSGTEFV